MGFSCRLRQRCARVGASAVLECIHSLQQGTAEAVPQSTLPPPSSGAHASKLPKSLSLWPQDASCLSAATLHARVRATGARTGVQARVLNTKHTIIIRRLQRHADVTDALDMRQAAHATPCTHHAASPPPPQRMKLPNTMAGSNASAHTPGTLVYDKSTKSLWLAAADDWLQVVQADLKSKPQLQLHVLANHLGLPAQGPPKSIDGVLTGPVAQLAPP